mgnify:CR=1 FL=1
MTLNYELDGKHKMIRMAVREFAESEIRPVAGDLEDNEEFSVSLTQQMGDIGLFGMVVPEKYGGQGLDYVSYIIAVEEIARVDGSQAATIAAGNSLGIGPLYYFGTEEQKQQWLPKMVSGEAFGALAMTEPGAGSDVQGIRTNAVRDGDDYVLNGAKVFITNGDIADIITVMALTDPSLGAYGGITAFIVEADSPGYEVGRHEDKMGIRCVPVVEIHLEDCRVPVDNLLGGSEGRGFKHAMITLDRARPGVRFQRWAFW